MKKWLNNLFTGKKQAAASSDDLPVMKQAQQAADEGAVETTQLAIPHAVPDPQVVCAGPKLTRLTAMFQIRIGHRNALTHFREEVTAMQADQLRIGTMATL